MTYATRILPALARLALVSFVVGLGASSALAANFYVRPGAVGDNSGSDWTNARTTLPTSWVRGTTYYFADGTLGDALLSSGTVSGGTSLVTLKKATVADHGTSTGWLDAYGDGNTEFGQLRLHASNISVDGQVGAWASDMPNYVAYGFRVIHGSYAGAFLIVIGQPGANATNVTVAHVEAAYSNTTDWSLGSGWDQVTYGDNVTNTYCWFHNAGQNTIKIEAGSNWAIDHCVVEQNGQGQYYMGDVAGAEPWRSNPEHSVLCMINTGVNGCTMRYSVWRRFRSTGGLLIAGGNQNTAIYGNVFTLGGSASVYSGGGQGCLNSYVTGAALIPGCLIYNNTFVDIALPGGYTQAGGKICDLGIWGADTQFRNNIIYNVEGLSLGNTNWIATHNAMGANTGGNYSSQTAYQALSSDPFVNRATYDFSLSGATSVGYTTGLDSTDPYGITRGADGVWDRGAFEFSAGAGTPGSPVLSSDSYSIAENSTPLAITVRRDGGTTGAVGVHYATSDGTAMSDVNYTLTSGDLTWADSDSTSRTVNVPIINASTYGNPTFTFTLSSPTGGATLGSPSSATCTINGVGLPPTSTLPWPATWEAEDGQYAAPFTLSSGSLVQNVTTGVADGGSATYTFVLPTDKLVKVLIKVKAEQLYQNSIFIDFNNATPTSPDMIWQVLPVTSGFENRYVGWQGSGTSESLEFPLKTWNLSAGTNTLYIRGREELTYLDQVTVEEIQTTSAAVIANVTTTTSDGYYKAGEVIPINIHWSTNVTVTGTPQLTLSTGATNATVNYSSGSGTSDLTFTYTVSASQNSNALDYTNPTALQLNGGTIKNSGVDSTLTLPAPGASGSLSYGRSIIIDTTAPVTTIGTPSLILTTSTSAVYPVNYTDSWPVTNIILSTNDVTVNTTGTATCTPGILDGTFPNQKIVQLYNVTGDGTLSISVAANTAFDPAGNPAGAAGPSATITVYTNRVMNAVSTHAGSVITKP